MTLCLLAILITTVPICMIGFCLTDGRVRMAVHLMLARRLGGVFAPDVIVVGDSLAAACPWKRLFRRPFGVLNLASGGATVKEIAGQIYLARDIGADWLLINGGLNDLLFDAATPQQFEADFCALFRRVQGDRRVIVTLAPFVSDESQADRIAVANRILSRLCAERGCNVVDLNPAVSKDGARVPAMTKDGLHFTAEAERVWLDAIGNRITQAPK